jgi:Tol biopolymer transport system component
VSGNQLPIAGNLSVLASTVAPLSASASGPIVFRTGFSNTQRQFQWFDRTGRELEKIGDPDSASPLFPSLSPNGTLLAFQRTVDRNSDIWQFDVMRGVPNRFTTDATTDAYPVWSSDSSQIIFSSNRKGVYGLYRMLVARTKSEELLLPTSENMQSQDWSRDGQFVLYKTPDSKQGYDLWALELNGGRTFPVVKTEFDEREGQFSPDGKWVAYQSNKSARSEIYVQPFPGSGNESRVSINGGAQARWRHDGKELFYIGLDDRLMAVPIRVASDGKTIEADKPVQLFLTRIGGAIQTNAGHAYAVAPDGRFLMDTVMDANTPSPITIILNWHPEQRK